MPLARSAETGDFLLTLPLLAGLYQYKFIVDGEWKTSPLDLVVPDQKGLFNNQRLVATSHIFIWQPDWGGADVCVTGDFVGWAELLPLRWSDKRNRYQLKCCLEPGTYSYQFLVDGNWLTAPGLPLAVDVVGHECNKVSINAPPAFYIYYATGWEDAEVVCRQLDPATGDPLEPSWRQVQLLRAPSRGNPRGGQWWVASIPLLKLDASNNVPSCPLEFFIREKGGKKREDRPSRGDSAYVLAGPGGYKLMGGRLQPFARALHARYMLVSDLDGTMIDSSPEGHVSMRRFTTYWEDQAALVSSILVYNTGRSLGQFMHLWLEKGGDLALPDVLITAVGTKVWVLDEEHQDRSRATGQQWREDLTWARRLDKDWDLAKARQVGDAVCSQYNDEEVHYMDRGDEHPHRLVLGVKKAVVADVERKLREGFARKGINAKIIISGQGGFRYVDCVAARAGKHEALEYVRKLYGIPHDRCVAAGDSCNDTLMLSGKNKALVVGNAQDELQEWMLSRPEDFSSGRLVWADAYYADGILEGLARHGLY